MNGWQAVVFGVVEGLTEFLPVSSTAHLVLTARLLGLPQTEFMKSFEIAIQLGAMLAVMLVYWRSFLLKPGILKRVLVALVPTLLLGLVFYKIVRGLLSSENVSLWGLLIGGLALIAFDLWYRRKPGSIDPIEKASLKRSFFVGVAQAMAMVPGVSRSGATIMGGLALGFDRHTIVEFSFLLGAPTILAAVTLDLFKNGPAFAASDWRLLLIGGTVSFAVAMASIKFFIRYVQNHGFIAFGVYRILLAGAFWIFVK